MSFPTVTGTLAGRTTLGLASPGLITAPKVRLTFLTALLPLLLVLASPARAQPTGGPPDILLTIEIDRIKEGFEEQLKQADSQSQISALAIRAAAMAWATSAAAVAGGDSPFPNGRLEFFQDQWDKAGDSWPSREILALKMYFEAVGRLAILIACHEPINKAVMEELSSLLSEANYTSFGRLKTKPTQLAEDRVFWSNRLSTMATIVIKLQNPDQMLELENQIVDLINRSEVISRREDIHYQARMELLYLNNAQGLASMLFLMAKSDDSPIIEQAQAMETAWQKHIETGDSQVATQNTLAWVTNTQLSFPLAWWLAAERLD
ncbi:MAG: hypothetical protein LBT47_13110 [Deltaproteobacteria bacterium]|jgi:hypothetical protein|nr:hypothetical protein [Deltaproteobacteria bacterium]